jgi:hypothetical protein
MKEIISKLIDDGSFLIFVFAFGVAIIVTYAIYEFHSSSVKEMEIAAKNGLVQCVTPNRPDLVVWKRECDK